MKSIVSYGVTFRVGDTVKSFSSMRTYKIVEIERHGFKILENKSKSSRRSPFWGDILWFGNHNRFEVIQSVKRKIKKTNWT